VWSESILPLVLERLHIVIIFRKIQCQRERECIFKINKNQYNEKRKKRVVELPNQPHPLGLFLIACLYACKYNYNRKPHWDDVVFAGMHAISRGNNNNMCVCASAYLSLSLILYCHCKNKNKLQIGHPTECLDSVIACKVVLE
jgi:hypothetical protein